MKQRIAEKRMPAAAVLGGTPMIDVHFGDDEGIDWERTDDSPDDDAELAVTPPDVVGILGFDPKEVGE